MSFIGSPECPFTQRKRSLPGAALYASTSGSQRSRFATGFFWLFNHPRAIQPCHHLSRKQLTTYVESLTTTRGPEKNVTASTTAVSSIRWFVV